ncbi:PepSY-associated TM helix domain-containing protein [Methylobacter sp. YRD-M1]|uniref:PepSY-associated TM helix domain-containing protein n=1 Tax=Methylobacter sp. YRD-M1 TaxID=2911520 RepID=UPI00227B02D0|nr:PepSY-associated TM helix domain-containing protein [Methylobacter sp. YRD-M1]WAK03678.1 PepSY domain-containing protein [Methylobacter sp. YRD-M1]
MSKKLWLGHLYLGIALALPLLIITVSGIVLCFYDDLRYAAPPYRLATPVHQPLPANALAESVQRRFPNHRLEVLFLPTASERSARARLTGPEPLLVFIHPGTAAILKTHNGADPGSLDWLRELHRGSALGLFGKVTASVVGLGVLFLWMMGLWLWFRRSMTTKWQQRRAKGSVAIHQQAGLLLGGPIAGLALLGALLNFAGPLMQWLDSPPSIVSPTSTERPKALPLPSLVNTATQFYRDASLERIYFPATASEPWRFRFLDGSWGFVNGQNGAVLKLKTPFSHWTMLLYPLHSGKLLGIYGHWLLVICGLVLLFLIGSGLRHGWRIIRPLSKRS